MSSIRKSPEKAVWWARAEERIGATFAKNRPSYAQMRRNALDQADMLGYEDEAIACFAGIEVCRYRFAYPGTRTLWASSIGKPKRLRQLSQAERNSERWPRETAGNAAFLTNGIKNRPRRLSQVS